MRNIFLIARDEPTKEDIQALVASFGGYWLSDPTLDEGVVERGPATIFIRIDQGNADEFDAAETVRLTAELGHAPATCVDIHMSSRPGSSELAWEFMNELVDRFGGVVEATSMRNEDKNEMRRTRSGSVYKPEW